MKRGVAIISSKFRNNIHNLAESLNKDYWNARKTHRESASFIVWNMLTTRNYEEYLKDEYDSNHSGS